MRGFAGHAFFSHAAETLGLTRPFDTPLVLVPLACALAVVTAFCVLLKHAAGAVVGAVAAALPLAVAAAALAAREVCGLPERVEQAAVALALAAALWQSFGLYSRRTAAVSIGLGASVLADTPSIFVLQAALLLPWALWARFVLEAVYHVAEDWASMALHALERALFDPLAALRAVPGAMHAALGFAARALSLSLGADDARAAAFWLSGAFLLLQLALATATLHALVSIAVARATASRFFGFGRVFGLGAASLFAAVAAGALGTAVLASSLYALVALLGRAARLLAPFRAVLRTAALALAAAAALATFVQPLPLLDPAAQADLRGGLWLAATLIAVLGPDGLDLALRPVAAFEGSANEHVAVVAGITAEPFAFAGAEAQRLHLRSPVELSATVAEALALARAAAVLLPLVSTAGALRLMTLADPAVLSTHLGAVAIGVAAATLFTWMAVESIYTASVASIICVIEQKEMDAALGVVGLGRRRSIVEDRARADLAGASMVSPAT